MRLYSARRGGFLFVCAGGNDEHEQRGDGRKGVCALGKDSGQLSEVSCHPKRSDPEKEWDQACEYCAFYERGENV